MPERGYAVIDFETIGLFPGGRDRVIEVAVVLNPGRDLGRQDIHRFRARGFSLLI